MTHGSLFSGIGGFDLAAEWMGWSNLFHCEWNPFGQRVLNHYWPNAESFTDITKTDFKKYANRIDVLTGGFPCQPFSTAGSRNGVNDGRYLWPEYLRAIREIKPLAVVGENVTGILSMEEREVFLRVDSRSSVRLDHIDQYEAIYTRQADMLVHRIIKDLEAENYAVQILAIPAAGVGAPHKRERIWFVAHSNSQQSQRNRESGKQGGAEAANNSDGEWKWNGDAAGDICKKISTSNSNSQLGCERRLRQGRNEPGAIFGNGGTQTDWRTWENFPTQPPVCNGDDGLSARLDGITFSKWRTESLKAGGNAIVPQVAYEIFKALQTHTL